MRTTSQEQIWDFIDRAGGKDATANYLCIEGVFEPCIMDDTKRSWKLQSIKEGKLEYVPQVWNRA